MKKKQPKTKSESERLEEAISVLQASAAIFDNSVSLIRDAVKYRLTDEQLRRLGVELIERSLSTRGGRARLRKRA